MDVADVVYAVHVERVERAALVERQVVCTLLAAGAKGLDVGTVEDARDAFDAALVAEPKVSVVDRDQLRLREALGVA